MSLIPFRRRVHENGFVCDIWVIRKIWVHVLQEIVRRAQACVRNSKENDVPNFRHGEWFSVILVWLIDSSGKTKGVVDASFDCPIRM